MDYQKLHDWQVPVSEAKNIQQKLRAQIQLSPPPLSPELVAGTDVSFEQDTDQAYAGITILQLPDLTEVARSLIIDNVEFPYIPGYLSFREVPPLLKAWRQLQLPPDLIIMDGHGIAHFRKLGLATHFGLLIQLPTIGCAKNKLVGTHQMPAKEKGSYRSLYYQDEKVGEVLRTRTNVNPVYVSPGHLIDFSRARQWVLRCAPRYKLPETTRKAHRLVNRLRKGEISPGYQTF
jgi:deoxyribonuclease V